MYTDVSFSLHLRMLTALAFVPPCDVVATFEELDQTPSFVLNKDVLERYMEYFTSTWIGGFDCRGNRKPPLFAIVLWNCRESVLQGLPKTNNLCEAFHRGFASILGVQRPVLSKFFEGLLQQHALSVCRLEQFNASQVEPPNPAAIKIIERLKQAVERYGTVSSIDFLRGVAHCFAF
jgi:hypothetical protein